MKRPKPAPRPAVPFQGPPLHFSIRVGGMFARYIRRPGEPLEQKPLSTLDPRPRFPIVEVADAHAWGWLR